VEKVAIELEHWKLEIEGKVDDIELEDGKLTQHWERSVRESAMGYPGITPQLGSTSVHPAGTTLIQATGRMDVGMSPHIIPWSRVRTNLLFLYLFVPGNGSKLGLGIERFPEVNFREFDGENPKLWLTRSGNYFESHRWIKFATMHFTKAAAHWLQSVEVRLRRATWDEFARMLLDHFVREQQELMLRQLFNIRQLGAVSDYVEQFSELFDQLIAYGYGYSTYPLYFSMRFIDVLKSDIKPIVLVQHLKDLDAAYSLALLQEDVSTPSQENMNKVPLRSTHLELYCHFHHLLASISSQLLYCLKRKDCVKANLWKINGLL
jgi:hypothetical protein